MGAAESKAVAASGDPLINNNPAALAGIAAAAGADGQAIPPSVTNMGNNASVPSADPNSIPPDAESNTVTVPGVDNALSAADSNDLQPQAESNDLQSLPESDLPELPEPQPLSVLLGGQDKSGGKDNRPVFLRRLVTAPSTALAAATHAENVSANALSSTPQKSQTIGAMEHLTKSNSPVTRESPASDPVELGEQDTAPAAVTLPLSRPSTRGSVSSVSSLNSAAQDFVPQTQWESIQGSGGDVSPLDRSATSSPAPGSFNELRRFSRVQIDGEILATEGSEQRLDMALESLSGASIPASPCGSAHTGHTFGSFAHPYGFDEDESCDDEVYEIRPEYLPLPDDATDGTADDELSTISVATSTDFDKHYSTGVTSQMSHELQQKLSSESLKRDEEVNASTASLYSSSQMADEEAEVQVDQTESDTECDRATTVGNVDDIDASEMHEMHDHSETKETIDAAPLEHDHQEVEESAVVETEEPIIAQDDNSNDSVEQPNLDIEAVDEPTPEPEHEEPRHVDAELPTAKQETDVAETPLEVDKVADSVEALELAGPTEGVENALTPTSQATEPVKDLKEPEPISHENLTSTSSPLDDLSAAAATPTAVATSEEPASAGSQDISSPMPFQQVKINVDNSDKASVYVPDFPAQEASVIVANAETMQHASESITLPNIEDVIQSKPSTPCSSASRPATVDATEPVSLKDILGESRVPGSPKDISMGPRDDQSGASLDLTTSLPREIIGKQQSNDSPRADSNASLAVQYPADDDGWAIPGREQDEPQSRLPVRNSRRKSLPMLFRDMKDSRKEKSLLPTKKESKDAKKEAKDAKKESKESKKESKSSKKDQKPVIATAAPTSHIPVAPLSAPITESSRSPFSPGRKSRNVLQRNPSTNRPLDQALASPPNKDKGKKRHGLLGAVFGRSTAAYDLNKEKEREKERERQLEKEKGKEKEKHKEPKEPKPKKKDSRSMLALPHRRYSLAGPLGGHDQIAPFAVPRVPTPKRVQEISALLRQDGPTTSAERPRSGSQSLNAVAREGPPTNPTDLAAAVSAAVDANRTELQSRVPRPGVIPEPGPEWEEWEQKARQLEGKVPDSPSSQISIPAVLHGPGTPNQAKLYPNAPDSYPFYQYAPSALPAHLQNGPKAYPFGPAPRSAAFDDYSSTRQVSGSSSAYGSLKRRYSEHYNAASARGLPPFPPHLYGLRDGEFSAPMRQTSQSQLRPNSHAGPSVSPSLSGAAVFRKSPEQEVSHLVESASPCGSNAGTADSFEHDLACMPPPVLLPGQTIEAFEMQRAWYEQMMEEENRRDSGYSAPFGYSPQPGLPFPPHLAAAPYGYPYPPQMYWPHAYPPPPGYPPAPFYPGAAAHTPEDYYHQALREQHQQELLDPRPGTPTDGGSLRAKSPISPTAYGYPFGPAPAVAPAPYGYPRREMRWRDLTPTEDSIQRAAAMLQQQQAQQSPASSQHKRSDSGIGASGSQQEEDNNNGGPISPLLPAAMQSAGSLLSVNNNSSEQPQQGSIPRRPTVGSMGRNSIRVMETVMEPVELADTDVGLRAGKMQAASYPGMEWAPEGAKAYAEE